MKSRNCKIDYMIVGAQKSGTTTLLDYLAQHPDLCVHETKEIGFFFKESEFNAGFARALARYFPHYQPGQRLIGKSVAAMAFEEDLARLRAHNAQMRLAAVLRNPVDRAYSAYWFARRIGLERADTFEEALDRREELSHIRDKRRRFNLDYLGNGNYVKQIRCITRYVEMEQLRIILFEDLKGSSQLIVTEIYRDLGVDSSVPVNYNVKRNTAAMVRSAWLRRMIATMQDQRKLTAYLPVNFRRALGRLRTQFITRIETEFTYPPMAPETRSWLLEYFYPYNRELERLVGVRLSGWY